VKPAVLGLLILTAVFSAQNRTTTFTGTITDDMCATGDHSRMRMGATDGECAIACVAAHGAQYVLYDGKTTYGLSDQKAPEKLAGKKVVVTGTLDAKTMKITVRSIAAAK
jgi:hypothetical protein